MIELNCQAMVQVRHTHTHTHISPLPLAQATALHHFSFQMTHLILPKMVERYAYNHVVMFVLHVYFLVSIYS